ncbi:MAG: aminopeptidase [Clostridia bacterium]|nr:aminopeptidase [Clostridia bacterium]
MYEATKDSAEKTRGQQLKDDLFYRKKNVYEESNAEKIGDIYAYADGYMRYLDESKTEREAVKESIAMLEKAGYREYRFGDPLSVGDKIYYNNCNKSLIACFIGRADLHQSGIRIVAAHVDSPRIDLKQNPLYEEAGMGFFKTHYYGGLKKYQWTALPLALHGVVVRADGTEVSVRIGEDEKDPVFYINDLLPHLGADQGSKPLSSAIAGENLNILVGGLPFADEAVDEKIKLGVLHYLYEKYGITESDFVSAELCAVPAFRARDIGFDRAFIGAYGHDDRVCAYPALTALIDKKDEEQTVMVVLADKEETGSQGNTGMQSCILSDMIDEISRAFSRSPARVRNASLCLSADVSAAYDPNFAEVYERRNSAMISCGTTMSKYTGARGKSGTNDASAETVARIRQMLNARGVMWQTSELGKVDQGGGGTVAMFISRMNIKTVDLGVAVISMHAPYEVISKADLYTMKEAILAFYEER